MKRVIFTLTTCLALLSACNENRNEFIGDYYHSRQLYPEFANSKFRNEIVFSINEDGTGFTNLSYEPSNNYSSENSGKFTWKIEKDPISNNILLEINWENGRSSTGTLMKGKFGKNILYLVVYDHDIKDYILQVVGEKMSKEELEVESKIQ